MSNNLIFNPAFFGLMSEQITSTAWAHGAPWTIDDVSGAAGIAIPFFGSGEQVKSLDVRIHSNSQAGTIHASIQLPSYPPNANNVSGLPDGVIIANGAAGSEVVAGGVNEVLTLTWATAPTPIGLFWLVLEASSAGVVDVVISNTSDYSKYTLPFQVLAKTVYHDGADWNNATTIGAAGVALNDELGNVLSYSSRQYPPYLSSNSFVTESLSVSLDSTVGVKFTAKKNLLKLRGFLFAVNTFGADTNFQLTVATEAGLIVGQSSVINSQIQQANGKQFYIPFDAIIELDEGVTYRAFFSNPDNTSGGVSIHYWDLALASDQERCWGMDDGEFSLCTADDPPEYGAGGSGLWTDDPSQMPWVQILFEDSLEDASGSGGGIPGFIC